MVRGSHRDKQDAGHLKNKDQSLPEVVQAAVMMKSKSEMRRGNRREVYRRRMGGMDDHSEKPRVGWGRSDSGNGFHL